ncbi:MAG: class I SAM-dependent methyltransferase [Alphaproteobacteria bacterium]|nr:class I SAM-dependent methyltransferase [Alphaproteobacteria bacterium]MCL2504665.1 class I SAM-dependent methyltransferase [Alphaproteobacteria bacterium]
MTDTFCKICGEKAFLLDVLDFNKSCLPQFNKKEPLSGIPVYYYGCPSCDFIFTTHCDNWTQEEFVQNIYNDKYVECDPDFVKARPIASAQGFEKQFPHFKELKILDFGSGYGLFGDYLNERGFNITSYDPFYGESAASPLPGSFDIVITTEVVEHSHTPLQTFEKCFSFLKENEPACFIAGTLLTPVPLEQLKHSLAAYWYIGPRNGHISFFSEKTMRLIAQKHGALYGGKCFFFRGFEKKMQKP